MMLANAAVNAAVNAAALKPAMSAPPVVFDPARPIPRGNGGIPGMPAPGQNQRNRRSIILATIRRLLTEEGFEGVAVRRIAECSGHAVQTIYNLVGPRELAITEAISEYSQYVNLTAMPDPEDPNALLAMIERELKSIEINPEFCRNVCLIYFTESRGIFYDFRERQIRLLHNFLLQQQKAGVVRAGVNTRSLAEHLILFLGTLCVEWADRPFPFEQLQQRTYAGYANLMGEAMIAPARRTEPSI